MIEMHIGAIALDKTSGQPIVVLQDSEKRRALPIWVGVPEAMAISMAAQKQTSRRPMTHPLMLTVIEQLGYKLDKVLITAIKSGAFIAEIQLVAGTGANGNDQQAVKIDARPSDALALATLKEAPVFVALSVVEEASVTVDEIDEVKNDVLSDQHMVHRRSDKSSSKSREQEDEEALEFRKFVESVKASDFKLNEGGEDRIDE